MKMLSDAEGFMSAFRLTFHFSFAPSGFEKWSVGGNLPCASVANGCFAVELFLKFLIVAASYQSSTQGGQHSYGHSLDELYDNLKNENQSYTNDLELFFCLSKYKLNFSSLRDFLSSISNYFEQWRYFYSSDVLEINLNTLWDVLQILDAYSLKCSICVTDDLSNYGADCQVTIEKQTISHINGDDLKKTDFLRFILSLEKRT